MIDLLQFILLIFILAILLKGRIGDLLSFGKSHKIVLDSCTLIDGRVVELVKSGFMRSQLVIPQFILNELQLLADGHESQKRERARFGLDIANQLQDTSLLKVIIDRTLLPEAETTDDKLIALTKKLKGQLFTTDYNLAKVAAIEGISVLNVNELSHSLRPIALPGESLNVKIVQKGSNAGQGVGYLDDGTMIVIDGAARYVGREVPINVTRMHQTVAGKMVFGQIRTDTKTSSPASRYRSTASAPSTSKSIKTGL